MRYDLFPLFLNLRDRRCLVVGAGRIAEGKIDGLLRSGAHIIIVAPEATEDIQDWAASSRITLHRRAFTPTDLDGAFLVIVATSSAETNHAIADEARRRNILCNVVDDPDYCDFFYPAVVRRGALQIAISTAGASPTLAKAIRERLEAQFGPEYDTWLEEVNTRRREILASVPDPEERRKKLEALVSDESFHAFKNRRD
jgi:precorrin-2 dehydrogenase/sirohydrochlorin ferrochelatase